MSDRELPPPLVPADCDLQDFQFMPVDVRRLLASDTWMLANGEERGAAMSLWLESWHQVPAGSLPNNDRALAHLSRAANWRKVREHVLRSWILCSDGRLYHPVVAEKALEAWLEKLAQRISGGEGNAKRWGVAFDRRPLEEAMEQTRKLLVALNPQSRALSKKRTAGLGAGSAPESPPDSRPDSRPESPPDSPPDSPPESRSHRKGQGQGQGYIKNPLSPLKRGNGAIAPRSRKPREIRSQSAAAWDQVIANVKAGEYRNGRTIGGPVDEAVRLIGGYQRIGMATTADLGGLRSRFRDQYEQLLERDGA